MKNIPRELFEKGWFSVVTRDPSTGSLRERTYFKGKIDYNCAEQCRGVKESLEVPETKDYEKVIMASGYEFGYKARRNVDGTLEVHIDSDARINRYTVKDEKVVRLARKSLGISVYRGAVASLIFWIAVFVANKRWKKRQEVRVRPSCDDPESKSSA
ncbi:MAG: hypothetical protein LBL72_03500 [Candidatus Accumulibacter sp.]|nr:hypothetical protein [Accumulibacter sp.]